MVGRQVNFKTEKIEAKPMEEVLSIANLIVHDTRKLPAVKGLDLTVRAGEIVGIAGIDGNGQSELIEAITGLRKVESGSIAIKGKEITNWPVRRITEEGLVIFLKTVINTDLFSIFLFGTILFYKHTIKIHFQRKGF